MVAIVNILLKYSVVVVVVVVVNNAYYLFQDPFYVRCIKPNEIKSPVALNDERIRHQVNY